MFYQFRVEVIYNLYEGDNMVEHKKDAKSLFNIWTENQQRSIGFKVVLLLGLVALSSVWTYFILIK